MGASFGMNGAGCTGVGWVSLLTFFVEEALGNMRRHGLVAAVTVLTVSLTIGIWGLFVLIVRGAQNWLLAEGVKVGQLRVFLKPQVDEEMAKRVMARIKGLPQVSSVRFIHKEEGLKRMQKLFGDSLPLRDLVGHNPLPHAIEVTCRSPQAVMDCVATIKKFSEVDEVTFWGEAVRRFLRFVRGIQWGANSLSLLLALVAFVLIHNALQLSVYGRREEIRIMQLVGATVWTVRGPLLMEGALYGLLGSLLMLGILIGLTKTGQAFLSVGYLRSVLAAMELEGLFAGQVIGLGVGFGFLSALAAALRLVRAI